MSKKWPSGSRRVAVTLIETLVVIGIITILAVISASVFMRARRSAKSTGCLSNLSQIGKALHLYLASNDDYYPPYVTYPRLRGAVTHAPETLLWKQGLEMFGAKGVWQCPLDPDLGGPIGAIPFFRSEVHGLTSYETVGSLGIKEESWPDGRMRLSGTALETSSIGYVSDIWWTASEGTDVVTVHGKDTHVLCHDGHVTTDHIQQK